MRSYRKLLRRKKYEDGGNIDYNQVAGYAQLGAEGVNSSIDSNQAQPTTMEDKYIASYVQENQTKQDDSLAQASNMVGEMYAPVGAAQSIGEMGDSLIAPENEYGYADSDVAAGVGAFVDPESTFDYMTQNDASGDEAWNNLGRGILTGGAANIYEAGKQENEEKKVLADRAKQEYAAQQLFNDNYDYTNTKQYNQSMYGNTYQLKYGGKMSYSNGGNIKKQFINNGKGTIYSGPTHEQGGIPLGKNTEVENNEVKYDSYVFSDKINYNG